MIRIEVNKNSVTAILALGLLFSTDLAFTQEKSDKLTVAKIRVEGDTYFSKKELLQWLGWPKGSLFSESEVEQHCSNLLREYQRQGFYFARVDSVISAPAQEAGKVNLDLYLTAGNRMRVDTLLLGGLDMAQAQILLHDFRLHPGATFTEATLEEDIDGALIRLENGGYPFAAVQISTVNLTSGKEKANGLGLHLWVNPGPLVTVDRVRIEGHTVTKESVIRRELRIRSGEVYDQRRVSRLRPRLMRLGFFKEVAEPEVFLDEKGRGGLLLSVTEGNTNQFDGVVGYNPAAGRTPGYFTGLLDVTLGNLLGTGRSVRAHWQKKDRQSQELKFHYGEPWVLGLPVHAGLGFEQTIWDTTYVERDWSIDLNMPVTETLTAFANVGHKEISPDSLGSVRFGIPESRTWFMATGVSHDTRDDRFNPRRGVSYRTAVELGRKRVSGPEAIIQQYDLLRQSDNKKLELDFELYVPTFRWQVISLGLHGRQITSNQTPLPITDQFRFGGTRTLRGYREDQFRGTKVAWANWEYRYLLGSRSRVFLFFDTGYYSRPETASGEVSAYKLGYGFGVRLETRLGILGVDYGLGEGDSLFNGKVHIGIVNEF